MREAKQKRPPLKAIALTGGNTREELRAGMQAGFDYRTFGCFHFRFCCRIDN
jgi:hypothetical protein